MSQLPRLKIQVDETGRGTFTIDDQPISGVVEFSLAVKPGLEFVRATFTVIGEFEGDIVLNDEHITAFVMGGAGPDDPDPPAD